jgi:hypothetical protein
VNYQLRQYAASRDFDGVVLGEGSGVGSEQRLGGFEVVRGWRVVRAALLVEQEHKTGPFAILEHTSVTTENYAFYDVDTATLRWLLPQGRRLIRNVEEIADSQEECPAGATAAPILALLYVIVESDSSGDDRLGADDAADVVISDPVGARVTRIATPVDEVIGSHVKDARTLLVFYRAKGVERMAEVNLAYLEIREDVPLAIER